jgi:hypothetical protein
MTTISTTAAQRSGRPEPAAGVRHLGRLGVRAGLPRGRAVIGALLIAGSGVGLLLAHQAATAPHLQSWLVAATDVQPGERIEAADLLLVPMDLAPETARRAFATGDPVVGQVARAALSPGDLVRRTDVGREIATQGPARRLTLDLSPAQALGGRLERGDRVDVLGSATAAADAGSGGTTLLASSVLVDAIERPDAGLGATEAIRITLVVADADLAVAVVDAASSGDVTLIAATALPASDGAGR